MGNTAINCPSCAVPLRPEASFCFACGAFVRKRTQMPTFPKVPLTKQNPLVALEGSFVPSTDPRSAPTPARSQQYLFTHRRKIADRFDESELLPIIEMEYENQVAPKQLDGSMSPLIFDNWQRYWKTVAQAVEEIRGLLFQEQSIFERTENETWSNPHPAFNLLKQRLESEFSKVLANLAENSGDMSGLVRFEIHLTASVRCLQLMVSRLEMLLHGECLTAMRWISELNDIGMRNLKEMSDWDVVSFTMMRAQEHANASKLRLHREPGANDAKLERYRVLEDRLCKLVSTDPEFYLDANDWLRSAAQSLLITTPGLFDKAMSAGRVQARVMVKHQQQQHVKIILNASENMNRARFCIEEDINDEDEARMCAEERHEAANREEQMSDEFVKKLVTEQVALSQGSEAQTDLALTTRLCGARALAPWEGFLK